MPSVFDFELNFDFDRDIKILQITDLQPVDFSQQRFEGRLDNIPIAPFNEEERFEGIYKYIKKLINENNPDLILVTGDIIYGEFDDNGSNLVSVSNFLNSFNIPWSVIFGNHENESKKGVAWQCKTLESYSNCLFKRGNVTGNSNFNIAIKKNGKLIKVIYMIDSNGCDQAFKYYYKDDYPLYNNGEKVEIRSGVFPDQIKYISKTSKKISSKYGNISKFICTHIPPAIIAKTAYENGYQSSPDNRNNETFDLDKGNFAKNNDFGEKGEHIVGFESDNLWPVLKENNFTHMFVGHDHKNSLSILCDGIRVTFGLKTGIFDYHEKIGGTLITINDEENVKIKHIYQEF